jgi:hypothetical protein
MTNQDCNGGYCLTEPDNGFPSGYCTEICDLMTGVCANGGLCLDTSMGGGAGVCFDSCSAQAMDCRDVYACVDVGGGSAVCLPDCAMDPECTITSMCDAMSGYCDAPPPMTATGLPCTGSYQCLSNNDDAFCLTEADQGWPQGYCSELCDLANDDCAGDAVCVDVDLPSGDGLCFDGCVADADCPTMGYVCLPAGGGVSVCAPPPPPESVCDNYLDDDGDSLQDCEDPDCQALAVCQPGMTATGAPCAANSECSANANDPLCLNEAYYGWPSGYCTEYCDLMNDDCAGDAICIPVGLQSGAGVCFDGCAVAASCQSPGYECILVGPMMGVCSPKCAMDNQCQDFCNPDTSLCDPVQEICGDSQDNDEDNVIDCEDLTCAQGCQPTIDMTCAAPMAAQPTNMGDTAGGTSVFSGCAGSGAPERVYTYTPPQNGTLTLVLSSASDLGLYVREDCDDKETTLECTNAAPAGGMEQIDIPVSAGVPVTIFVDGAGPMVTGAYTLTVTLQ